MQMKFEPFSDDVDTRLVAMKELAKRQMNISCRIQPIIPQFINTLPSLIDKLNDANCHHIILEYLKLPVEKNSLVTTLISEILD